MMLRTSTPQIRTIGRPLPLTALAVFAFSCSAFGGAMAEPDPARGPPSQVVEACLTNAPLDKAAALMPPPATTHAARRKTVDVTSLGARPDDGRDDAEALKSIPAGVVAHFPKGTYDLATTVPLRSGTTYSGAGTLKRSKPSAAPLLAAMRVSDVVIEGLTFKGGGLLIGGNSANVRIAGNHFTDIIGPRAKFGFETGIFVKGRLSASEISGNRFSTIGVLNGRKTTDHGAGIQAYHLDGVSIRGNVFHNVHQGISIILEARPETGRAITVADNVVVNPLRMGIELWGRGMSNAIVQGNCVRARRSGDQDVALSVVADGTGSRIQNNLVIQLQPPTADCTGIGIEVAGRGARVTANTAAGDWCASIATYNERGWSADISGNLICGHRGGSHSAIDFTGGQGASTTSGNFIESSCRAGLLAPLP